MQKWKQKEIMQNYLLKVKKLITMKMNFDK